MNIELITIGDEILLGHTVDSNANWIARRLTDHGLRLRWHDTIGDNESDIKHTLNRAWNRADVVLVTGGLGPTHDDITCAVIARFFSDDLIERVDIKQQIIDRFAIRGVAPPLGFDRMAMFPANAKPLINKHGSAPGIYYDIDGRCLFAMPGVPTEMKGLFNEFVLPHITSLKKEIFKSTILRTSGIGESNLEVLIGDPAELSPVTLAYLPSIDYGVTLRLSCSGIDENQVQRHLDQAEAYVTKRVKKYIFTVGEKSFEEVILDMMRQRNLTLAVAESCTGGMVCDRLVAVPGSSDVLDRGFITYSNKAKMEQLGVDESILNDHGAVSESTARAMAEGARTSAGVGIGISVTGIAGPTGGSEDKPVGLVFVGIADKNGTDVKRYIFSGDRNSNRRRTANAVLTLLWNRLKVS